MKYRLLFSVLAKQYTFDNKMWIKFSVIAEEEKECRRMQSWKKCEVAQSVTLIIRNLKMSALNKDRKLAIINFSFHAQDNGKY